MKTLVAVGFFWFSSLSIAAVSLDDKKRAIDILKLSKEEKSIYLNSSDEELYQGFKKLAFSKEEPLDRRWQAIITMAQMKKKKSVDDLYQISYHKEWFMKNAALVAMKLADPFQVESLSRRLLQDKALVVRSAAVEMLKDKDQNLSVRQLLWSQMNKHHNIKNGESLWIRPQILEILAENPKETEKHYFIEILKGKDAELWESSILALEKITKLKLGKKNDTLSKKQSMWIDYDHRNQGLM